MASKPDARGLVERMRAAADQMQVPFDEAQLVDTVNRALARADVLLLIVETKANAPTDDNVNCVR